MREDRMATWTSGEPVSPALVANSFITRAFSSAVIDIGVSFRKRVMAQAGMSSSRAPGGLRKCGCGPIDGIVAEGKPFRASVGPHLVLGHQLDLVRRQIRIAENPRD